MKKLLALGLVIFGIGANLLACGCGARRQTQKNVVTNRTK